MANRITEQLIRKKSEHNDGLLGDLEELSLHQCELGRMEVVGTLCRKLRILYLQNNVIPKIENCEHLKDLRYLNLALNNVSKIEGLQNCEFLNKLDLTVNFVDVDAFEESVDHLAELHALRELFLMGNPCTEWEGHRPYLIARCPQITLLDGKEITRTDRILAAQQLPKLTEDLKVLAAAKRKEKIEQAGEAESKGATQFEGDDDRCDWTPEVRLEMAEEQAEQKRKEEERKKEMMPKERNYEHEHQERVGKEKEYDGSVKPSDRIRQCNEGRYEFHLEDEDGKGNVVLSIPLPKFLDNCLLSVDVHPTFITVIIKGKVLRLALPEEVKPDAGSAKRSRTTGALVITMPKERPNLRLARRLKEREREEREAQQKAEEARKAARRAKLPKKVGDALYEAAGSQHNSAAVDVTSIVKKSPGAGGGADMTARSTTRALVPNGAGDGDGAGGGDGDGGRVDAVQDARESQPPAGYGGNDSDNDGSDWEDDADVPPLE